MNSDSAQKHSIDSVLNTEQHPFWLRHPVWLAAALILLLLAIAGYFYLLPADVSTPRFETSSVEQGDLVITVTATGTVQPVNQVDVGSELSGTIESVYVDFNERVQRGQVLARLDTERLKAQVVEASASLASAQAKLEEARSTVIETGLKYARCKKLAERQLCAGEELDIATAAQARAKAGEASAKALVEVARATLEVHQSNLAKAEIRSPVDGLVLRRQIEPGQTVAASLQAPLLFTLAEDLAQMELHVAIDEADVGKVSEGQSAQFSVDAYPERYFPAQITQVRFAPQTVEGVVTYETVLSVDNSGLSLRPGMTATAVITVEKIQAAVLIPNAALRFVPVTTAAGKRSDAGIFGGLFRRAPQERRRPDNGGKAGQRVWVLRDGEPVSLAVKVGASDGKVTEMREGDVQPGQEVIIDAVNVKK